MARLIHHLDIRVCLRIIEERLKSDFEQKALCEMENETKCGIHKFLVDNFCLLYYLVKPIPKLCLKEVYQKLVIIPQVVK